MVSIVGFVFSFLKFLGFTALALPAGEIDSATIAKQGVSVEIYYESLCPDSVRFFKQQFQPNYDILKQCMDVEYVPFGKASWIEDESGNPQQFSCQHGEAECEGNRVMACILEYTTDKDVQAAMMSCIMSASYPPTSGEQCAQDNGVNWKPEIAQCIASSEANQLLKKHGLATYALEPALTFVPTVVVNGDPNDQNRLNFKAAVCQYCGC